MRKIVFVFTFLLFCSIVACSSSENKEEIIVTSNDVATSTFIHTNTPTITQSITNTPTPIYNIDDVEIYFDKNLVTFTSKEETETVYLTVDLNGYMGKVDFEYDVTGYGNVNISSGESKIEAGKFTVPLYISPIENCTLIVTYRIKGTYESTDITIVTNFFD